MNSLNPSSPLPSCEFLTVEELAERLQVSRATLFNWMQKGILAQGRHFFKRGRVLRFVWSNDFIQELLEGSLIDGKKPSPLNSSPVPIKTEKSSPINWEY